MVTPEGSLLRAHSRWYAAMPLCRYCCFCCVSSSKEKKDTKRSNDSSERMNRYMNRKEVVDNGNMIFRCDSLDSTAHYYTYYINTTILFLLLTNIIIINSYFVVIFLPKKSVIDFMAFSTPALTVSSATSPRLTHPCNWSANSSTPPPVFSNATLPDPSFV